MLTPFAHGIVGRADLPLPAGLFALAACLVLLISLIALGAGWTRPRLEEVRERPLFRLPRVVDVLLSAVGLTVFVMVVYAGLTGTTDPNTNLASLTISVTFWVGVPIFSLVLGDIWRSLSPWRTVGRIVGVLARSNTEPLKYPPRLGRWPAVVVLFGWGMVELCWGNGSDPRSLATLALVMFAVNLVGQGLYGVAAWERNGDGFGIYFSVYAAASPWRLRDDRTVMLRPPLSGLPAMLRPAGTVALMFVVIGTTMFDGSKEGPLLSALAPSIQDSFEGLGMTTGAALEWTFVLGLIVCIAVIGLLYLLGVWGIGGSDGLHTRALAYVHTLVPIAAAYVFAHYFSYFIYNVQLVPPSLRDPVGSDSSAFYIDYTIVGPTAIWWVQMVTLVIGHIAAIILAHDRALVRAEHPAAAVRSQLVMVCAMMAFTVLGLWLLSVANAS